MKTDIDRLHLVKETIEEIGTYSRRIGKTVYQCHQIAGRLELMKNDTVVVILSKLDRVTDFWSVLKEVLGEHDLEIIRVDNASFRVFMENGNFIKFMSLDSIKKMHPMDVVNDYRLIPVYDLDYQNSDFIEASESYPIKNINFVIDKVNKFNLFEN